MPNGIDPKAYAARVTQAKKKVAAIDPATKAKLEQYYPKVTKEDIAKQVLGTKKIKPEEKKMRANMAKPVMKKAAAKPMAKPAVKAAAKTVVKAAAKKLVGPAAVAELKKQVSPKGVKKAEAGVKKAVDKKYPGLYKKSK